MRADAKVFTSLMPIYSFNSYWKRSYTDWSTVQAACTLFYNHNGPKRPICAYYSYDILYHELFYGDWPLNYSTPYCMRCMRGMTYYLHDQIWPGNDRWHAYTIYGLRLKYVGEWSIRNQHVDWMNGACMNMDNAHSMDQIGQDRWLDGIFRNI